MRNVMLVADIKSALDLDKEKMSKNRANVNLAPNRPNDDTQLNISFCDTLLTKHDDEEVENDNGERLLVATLLSFLKLLQT